MFKNFYKLQITKSLQDQGPFIVPIHWLAPQKTHLLRASKAEQ